MYEREAETCGPDDDRLIVAISDHSQQGIVCQAVHVWWKNCADGCFEVFLFVAHRGLEAVQSNQRRVIICSDVVPIPIRR
jgi:hypothetical protein